MDQARIVLLTQQGSKRERYFCSALQTLHANASVFYDVADYWAARRSGDVLKLDPPDVRAYGVEQLSLFTDRYMQGLSLLSSDQTLRFLNAPSAIGAALDKRATKQALIAAGIPTPAALAQSVSSFDALLETMQAQHCGRVFVKPRFGSGAAGVCAFAWSFQHNRGVIYTSLAQKDNRWINTKRVQKSTDASFCRAAINFVLSLDAVVERWVPKPRVAGFTFDLRVVWQFGQIETIIVRGSKSPITNLHLNDMALQEHLAQEWINRDRLLDLCTRAVTAIPGLRSAGLDILCTPDGYQVIEINSQGDLIYRDIDEHNIIYTSQARYLVALARQSAASEILKNVT